MSLKVCLHTWSLYRAENRSIFSITDKVTQNIMLVCLIRKCFTSESICERYKCNTGWVFLTSIRCGAALK